MIVVVYVDIMCVDENGKMYETTVRYQAQEDVCVDKGAGRVGLCLSVEPHLDNNNNLIVCDDHGTTVISAGTWRRYRVETSKNVTGGSDAKR